MANLSYTPTFHHQPWRDRLDRVEAAGPNGFNGRFAAIESDLREASTVVDQIGSAVDRVLAGSQHKLAFTPTLRSIALTTGFSAWSVTSSGVPWTTLVNVTQDARGIMNLALPHGARLTSLRARGQLTGTANPSASLTTRVAINRVPRIRSVFEQQLDVVVGTGIHENQHTGPFDTTDLADDAKAQVDSDKYRYVLTADVHADNPNGLIVTLTTIDITYTA